MMTLREAAFLMVLSLLLLDPTALAASITKESENITTISETGEFEDLKERQLLRSLELPEYLSQDYPYYFAGYDRRNQPVWIIDWGKWDLKKIVNADDQKKMEFDEYVDQLFGRIQKSISRANNGKVEVTKWVSIVDMKDYNIQQLDSLQSIVYLYKFAEQWKKAAENLDYGFIVNTANEWKRLAKTIGSTSGTPLDKMEIYGSDVDAWSRRLLRKIPKQTLPVSFGGLNTFPQFPGQS